VNHAKTPRSPLEFWQKRDQFEGISNLSAYLSVIAQRKFYSALNSEQKRNYSIQQYDLFQPGFDEIRLPSLEKPGDEMTLSRALEQLSRQDRFILIEKYVNKKTFKDIAKELRVHPNVVSKRAGKALFELRKRFLAGRDRD
jgi:RNA polymerase sigma factor (sigma-70 family)